MSEELDLARGVRVAVAYLTVMRGAGSVEDRQAAFMACFDGEKASPASVLVALGDIALFALNKVGELAGEDTVERYLQLLAVDAAGDL